MSRRSGKRHGHQSNDQKQNQNQNNNSDSRIEQNQDRSTTRPRSRNWRNQRYNNFTKFRDSQNSRAQTNNSNYNNNNRSSKRSRRRGHFRRDDTRRYFDSSNEINERIEDMDNYKNQSITQLPDITMGLNGLSVPSHGQQVATHTYQASDNPSDNTAAISTSNIRNDIRNSSFDLRNIDEDNTLKQTSNRSTLERNSNSSSSSDSSSSDSDGSMKTHLVNSLKNTIKKCAVEEQNKNTETKVQIKTEPESNSTKELVKSKAVENPENPKINKNNEEALIAKKETKVVETQEDSSSSTSSSDSDTSDDEAKNDKKVNTQKKTPSQEEVICLEKVDTQKKTSSEEEVICLGNVANFENLIDDDEKCLLCDREDHSSFHCQTICRNCGEKYHNFKSCPKPVNISLVLQQFMEFCMKQCSNYNPNERFETIFPVNMSPQINEKKEQTKQRQECEKEYNKRRRTNHDKHLLRNNTPSFSAQRSMKNVTASDSDSDSETQVSKSKKQRSKILKKVNNIDSTNLCSHQQIPFISGYGNEGITPDYNFSGMQSAHSFVSDSEMENNDKRRRKTAKRSSDGNHISMFPNPQMAFMPPFNQNVPYGFTAPNFPFNPMIAFKQMGFNPATNFRINSDKEK